MLSVIKKVKSCVFTGAVDGCVVTSVEHNAEAEATTQLWAPFRWDCILLHHAPQKNAGSIYDAALFVVVAYQCWAGSDGASVTYLETTDPRFSGWVKRTTPPYIGATCSF